MANDVTVRQNQIKVSIENRQKDMFEVLPAHVNKDRFIKSAMLAAYNNQRVRECTPVSIVTAVYNAAELGLDFTPAKGHAYLVPFKGEAKFMPGYRGLMELCRRSGIVKKIEAHVVNSRDRFELEYGTNSRIIHAPYILGDPGPVIGAYASALLSDGVAIYEFMTLVELEKVRKISRAADSDPWTKHTDEMYKKTVIRRLFKYLPSSPDLDRALDTDNELYDLHTGGRPVPAPIIPPELPEAPVQAPEVPPAAPAQEPPKRQGRPKTTTKQPAEQPQEQTPPPMQAPETAEAGQAPDIF